MRIVLFQLMIFCFMRAIFGRQIDRLAGWIAKDRRITDGPMFPRGYLAGGWR